MSTLFDLLKFVWDAIVFYAETPQGAAELTKIEQDLAGQTTGAVRQSVSQMARPDDAQRAADYAAQRQAKGL